MADELESCPNPWCDSGIKAMPFDMGIGRYRVICGCDFKGPYGSTRDEAITAWNTRASGWQDIASAPRDGTVIDVWRDGSRETVYWGLPPHECGEMGHYCDSDWHGIKSPGWVCATFGEFVGCRHDPFTHWQPLPSPPVGEQ